MLATPVDFFRAVFGDFTGFLLFWEKHKGRNKSYWVDKTDLERKLKFAAEQNAKGADMYFGLSLRAEALGPHKRGEYADCSGIGCLWVDLDCVDAGHSKNNLPATRIEALDSLSEAFPHPPSAVVDSAGGIHAYWFMGTVVKFKNDEQRDKTAALSADFQAILRNHWGKKGWGWDNTADLPRILRIPGTHNHKLAEPRPVELLTWNPERIYSPRQLRSAVPHLTKPKPVESPQGVSAPIEPANPEYIANVALQKALGRAGDGNGDDTGLWLATQLRDNQVPEMAALNTLETYASRATVNEREPFTHIDASRWWKSANLRPARDGWEKSEKAPPPPRSKKKAPGPMHPTVGEKPKKSDGRKIVHVPNGADHVEASQSAREMAEALRDSLQIFNRSGVLYSLKKERSVPILTTYDCAKLVTDIEEHACVYTTVSDNGNYRAVPKCLKLPDARVILASNVFIKAMPDLVLLTRCPVITSHDGELIVVQGYHRETGIYAFNTKTVIEPSIEEAVPMLSAVLDDFNFVSESDRSRAIAAMITPALIQGGLLGGRAPIDLGEANASQAGKGFRAKLVAAIYSDVPTTINKGGDRGASNLDDSFSAALIKGANFISLDNVRGRINSEQVESALTEDFFMARAAFEKHVLIPMKRVVVMMTSNRAEMTTDLANRCSPVSIRKQPEGYSFKMYPEGDLLQHVRTNQAKFLGAVFAVVRSWWIAGRPKTDESRHDFRSWAQTLDWIVKNLFKSAPLCDGVKEIKQRITTPNFAWIRAVCLAIEKENALGQWIRANRILEILANQELDIPGLKESQSIEELTDEERGKVCREIGKRFSKLMSGPSQSLDFQVDGYSICKKTEWVSGIRNEATFYHFAKIVRTADPEVSKEEPSEFVANEMIPF